MTLYAQLCCPEFLLRAWRRVECRKGMAGTDGQTLDSFRRDRDGNVTRISDSLKNGTYNPSPLRGVKIPKNGGGFRRLGVPTVKDRIVFQGANRLLADVWDPFFAPLSFAYRPGRSITDAIDAMKNQKPMLILQLKKSGNSRQARKLYKVSYEGMKRVEGMIGG